MADPAKPQGGSEKVTAKARQDRLAEALRANLRRRKDQKRGRDAAQETADGAVAGDNKNG